MRADAPPETLPEPADDAVSPGLDQILRLALETLDALPKAFRGLAAEVALRVEEFPDDEMLEALDLTDAFELTGLYEGIPLTEKSVSDQPVQPDTIWLFRRPILDEWADRGNVSLREMVAHVVIHELAHHFGWSDDDIAALAPWWD